MQNKYSLNAESYGISKVRWREIKETVAKLQIDSTEAVKRFNLEDTLKNGFMVASGDKDLCKKRVWFLYDILLQEKYNHLYKREKLVNPKVGDYVYSEGSGRGTVKGFSLDKSIIIIKFDIDSLSKFCDAKTLTVNIDNEKVKITRL